VTRRYLDRTMVLETAFRTPTGAVAITDALAMGDGNRGMSSARVRRIRSDQAPPINDRACAGPSTRS
jgi:hypothetical protein